MAIAAASPGYNDLGRSVTPTFLSRNRFYSQLQWNPINTDTNGTYPSVGVSGLSEKTLQTHILS